MAADSAQAIINNGSFALDSATGSPTAYFNLFNRTYYSTSKEVIFWKRDYGTQIYLQFLECLYCHGG